MTKQAAIPFIMGYNSIASQTGIDQVRELGCGGFNWGTGTMGVVAVYFATHLPCTRGRLCALNVQCGEV